MYRDTRKEYIINKYINRKYVEHMEDYSDMQLELLEAVELRDIRQLLQVYAEGVDMCTVLPTLSCGRTALHLAIEQEDLTSLHIIDFILGNRWPSLLMLDAWFSTNMIEYSTNNVILLTLIMLYSNSIKIFCP